MQMRMEKQVLSPTVKYGEKTDLGAQMLGIGSDGRQGLGSGSGEYAVDEVFVLVSTGTDLFGNREDDLKKERREDFCHSFFFPLHPPQRLKFFALPLPAPLLLTLLI